MRKLATLAFIVALASACAHKSAAWEDTLRIRLRDFHNLKAVGCYRDYVGALRVLYLKETVAGAGCFSVHFGRDGEVHELRAMRCGALDDELMNSDCALAQ